MSDLIAGNDAAIETVRERVRQLDAELANLATATRVATAGRELLLDLIATLSRKPKARRPRVADAADAPPIAATAATRDSPLTGLLRKVADGFAPPAAPANALRGPGARPLGVFRGIDLAPDAAADEWNDAAPAPLADAAA